MWFISSEPLSGEVDDELSQYYLQKDVDKFWKNGRVGSQKRM